MKTLHAVAIAASFLIFGFVAGIATSRRRPCTIQGHTIAQAMWRGQTLRHFYGDGKELTLSVRRGHKHRMLYCISGFDGEMPVSIITNNKQMAERAYALRAPR